MRHLSTYVGYSGEEHGEETATTEVVMTGHWRLHRVTRGERGLEGDERFASLFSPTLSCVADESRGRQSERRRQPTHQPTGEGRFPLVLMQAASSRPNASLREVPIFRVGLIAPRHQRVASSRSPCGVLLHPGCRRGWLRCRGTRWHLPCPCSSLRGPEEPMWPCRAAAAHSSGPRRGDRPHLHSLGM